MADHKSTVLSRSKFTLAFENTAFAGYITEKIFDAFLSGTIPIYLGAPDITSHIPKEAFIDFRAFTDYSDLETFLDGMSLKEAHDYLTAAADFLSSDRFDRYTSEHFANELVTAVTTEA